MIKIDPLEPIQGPLENSNDFKWVNLNHKLNFFFISVDRPPYIK